MLGMLFAFACIALPACESFGVRSKADEATFAADSLSEVPTGGFGFRDGETFEGVQRSKDRSLGTPEMRIASSLAAPLSAAPEPASEEALTSRPAAPSA